MTAARILGNPRPSHSYAGLQPMADEQARFWQLRRERKHKEKRT